jgi:hypothetical protein
MLLCTLVAWCIWFAYLENIGDYLWWQWLAYGTLTAMEFVVLVLLFQGKATEWYRAAPGGS